MIGHHEQQHSQRNHRHSQQLPLVEPAQLVTVLRRWRAHKVDEKADVLYLRLDDSKILESEEVSPGVVLDFNADAQVVGIEILNLSKRSPKLNLRELQFQAA